jgi:hypothetical protein
MLDNDRRIGNAASQQRSHHDLYERYEHHQPQSESGDLLVDATKPGA